MKYFIGYLCEGEVSQYWESLTEDLSQRFRIQNLSLRVPPHLTLVYPFEFNDVSVVVSNIEKYIETCSPAPFEIDGFGKFDNKEKTFYLSVKASKQLSSLVENFVNSIGDLDEEQKFDLMGSRLHMSVARHLDARAADLIGEYLETLKRPNFLLSFGNITLFVFKKQRWEIEKIFRIL